MKHLLGLCVLLTVLGSSAVFGAERMRLAQAGQTVTPVPAPPPSLNLTTTSCQISCDSSAMSCLNNCGGIAGSAANAQPDLRAQCSLSCTSQQLVCKQRC
jgi:hypothetical protein